MLRNMVGVGGCQMSQKNALRMLLALCGVGGFNLKKRYVTLEWPIDAVSPVQRKRNMLSLLLYETYANEEFRLQDFTKISPGVRNSIPIIA